jgi:hypothetical protein
MEGVIFPCPVIIPFMLLLQINYEIQNLATVETLTDALAWNSELQLFGFRLIQVFLNCFIQDSSKPL